MADKGIGEEIAERLGIPTWAIVGIVALAVWYFYVMRKR